MVRLDILQALEHMNRLFFVGNFVLISLLLFLCYCQKEADYLSIPPVSATGNVNVVVEIPAGTNDKMEFNKESGLFEQDEENGKPRVITFLPYPGNYGFIPGTLMDRERGGDGDAMDILVLGPHQETGTVIEVKPIGVLLLEDRGQADHKVIAVPADPNLQTIPVENFLEFLIEYDAAKKMVEDWFLNYKGWGKMKLIGWEDEQYAKKEINKWRLN